MPRILIAFSLLVAGFLPLSSLALGLGEINLKSALNQPFLAEIPVTSDSADELDDLKISLASADTFERYGLLLPQFLTDFEFDIVQVAGGSAVRVSSADAVIEPFVTMLLDVRWPQGRLLREYTVLLDPPVFESQPVRPPAPVVSAPERTPVASPAPAQRQPSPSPTPRPAPAALSGGSYGPVARNDTLWAIAQRVRPDDSIDVNQMMLAIFRSNPQAFAGNINRLQAGAILTVPDASEARALTTGQAMSEVRRQNAAWSGTSSEPASSARLRLVPPADDSSGQPEPVSPTSPETAADDSAAADARVGELEARLAERDRLLELKDAELAKLQEQLDAMQRAGEAPLEPPVGSGVSGETAPPTEPSADEDLSAADAGSEAPAADPGATGDAESGTLQAEAEVSPPAATVTTTATTESPSLVNRLLGLFGNLWVWLGIAAAMVVALLVARNRRQTEPATGDWDQMLDTDVREATGDTSRIEPPGRADETFVVEESPAQSTDQFEGQEGTAEIDRSGDQELPLERTLSSDSALDLDQADPIAEAEFHMAYGLYDQAADLLVAALEAEPGRTDLRRKLIDVYFVWENKGGFLKEAQALHDQVGDDDGDWNKVLIMGRQLCPDEDLFAGTPSTVGSGDELIDMDFSVEDDESGGEVDLALGDSEDGDLDLDLSAIREVPADGLDFDLGDATNDDSDLSPTAHEESAEGPTMETPTIEAAGLDSPTVESPTIESPMSESTMETPTIESPAVDIDSLPKEASDETASLDLDELGLDLSDLDSENAEDSDDADIADDDETLLAPDLDDDALLGKLDATAEVPGIGIGDDSARVDVDATGEMLKPDEDLLSGVAEDESSDSGDTVEQPRADTDDTAEQPGPDAAPMDDVTEELLAGTPDLGAVDLDIGEAPQPEDSPTGTMGSSGEQRTDSPTMTEVGTKLDLARAYIDMGDPDGARSILDEVVEEGDEGQRQEARQMLDQLQD